MPFKVMHNLASSLTWSSASVPLPSLVQISPASLLSLESGKPSQASGPMLLLLPLEFFRNITPCGFPL